MDYVEYWNRFDAVCDFMNAERNACDGCPIQERIGRMPFEDAFHAAHWAGVGPFVNETLICRAYVAMRPNSIADILEMW